MSRNLNYNSREEFCRFFAQIKFSHIIIDVIITFLSNGSCEIKKNLVYSKFFRSQLGHLQKELLIL